MKLRYLRTDNHRGLRCIFDNDKDRVALVSLHWREHDKLKTMDFGVVGREGMTCTLDLSTLGVTHHWVITYPGKTYTRYIPSRYLDLGSEHA